MSHREKISSAPQGASPKHSSADSIFLTDLLDGFGIESAPASTSGQVHEIAPRRLIIDSLSAVEVEILRSNRAETRIRAQTCIAALRHQIDAAPKGTVFAIDLASGSFVAAPSSIAAIDAFQERFGHGRTLGWLHEVGRRVVIGGGLGKASG